VTTDEWIAAYAAAVGVPPPAGDEIDQLLRLAGVAAHASERTAAPITCWIAARADIAPAAALALAESMATSTD
jgi:hypothetical protein